MKKTLVYIILFDLLFVSFLFVSGVCGGILGNVFYYLAFVFPIALAFMAAKKGGVGFYPPKLNISRENLRLTLPCVAPTLALIFFVSFLTSLLLSHFGGGSTTDVSGNIVLVIFTHAFLTAVLEETLFRYIPLAYLAPYSKRAAVLLSAVFFALAHGNPYQIPYAFIAGVVFAALDIAFDSVIPSFTIHFVNNLASIFWLRYGNEGNFGRVYVIVLISATVLSFVPIFFMRDKYRAKITSAFDKCERQ